jgi:hypothetical protein
MPRNLGLIDRILRLVFAAFIATLVLSGTIQGTLALILSIFAGVFVLTSLLAFCPLYFPFKLSTLKKKA